MEKRTCRICGTIESSESKLRDHFKTYHSDDSPFPCPDCSVRFDHHSSMMRHRSKNRCSNPKRSEYDTKVQSPVTNPKRARPNIPDSELEIQTAAASATRRDKSSSLLFASADKFATNNALSKCSTFAEWAEEYRFQVQNSPDTPFAPSVFSNVEKFLRTVRVEQPLLLSSAHSSISFAEEVDLFIDRQSSIPVTLQTITQRLRYLKWYLCFMLSRGRTERTEEEEKGEGEPPAPCRDCFEDLECTISELQASTTCDLVNRSLLDIYNPYALLKASNQIVLALEKERAEVIDPFITRFLSCPSSVESKELVAFGTNHLRCWVELAIRFTNVPTRVQVTRDMVGPDDRSDNVVSRLVIGQGGLSRVIQNDKLGNKKQCTSIPLDDVTSGYLLFYYLICRPNPSSHHVFQTSGGNVWSRVSRDLKAYLEGLGVPCEEMCPNGRFIHTSRNIGIACFAVLCDFDIGRIRNYCTLLRHQLINVEHIYSPWIKVAQSRHASDDILRLRGGRDAGDIGEPENTEVTMEDRAYRHGPSSIVRNLEPLRGVVATGFRKLLSNYLQDIAGPIVVRRRSVGTQTADPRLETNSSSYGTQQTGLRLAEDEQDSLALQTCSICHSAFSVLGPVGLSRNVHFGKYFTQCTVCHGKTTSKHSLFYSLGYVPPMKSISTKPRNMEAIQNYIQQHSLIENTHP